MTTDEVTLKLDAGSRCEHDVPYAGTPCERCTDALADPGVARIPVIR